MFGMFIFFFSDRFQETTSISYNACPYRWMQASLPENKKN